MARILDGLYGNTEAITRLLTAVEEGKLASTYLFIGPSGVGKKRIALGVLQALVCENDRRGCGQCPACVRVEKENSESLLIIKPSGTQIKIEDSHRIIDFISFRSLGRARMVIIDEAHLLNVQAANALLKVLEEPPENTYFVLVASSLLGVLPTIRSRSQVIRFGGLDLDDIKKITQAPDWLVAASRGSLNFVEQQAGDEWQDVRVHVEQYFVHLLSRDRSAAIQVLAEDMKDKKSALFVILCFESYLRDAMWFSSGHSGLLNADKIELIESLSHLGETAIAEMAESVLSLEWGIQQNFDRQLLMENFWLKCMSMLNSSEMGAR